MFSAENSPLVSTSELAYARAWRQPDAFSHPDGKNQILNDFHNKTHFFLQ
jgi:hypothetical protein